MARKLRRWWAAEHSMPTAAQPLDIEIAQLRNLDIQRFTVRQRRIDPDAWASGKTPAMTHSPQSRRVDRSKGIDDTIVQ